MDANSRWSKSVICWPVDKVNSTNSINANKGNLIFMMKIASQVFSVLLFLTGLVFFLQGINLLPGSSMTGDPQWAINGAVIMFVAVGVFIWMLRRK